jgi:MFS family permease
MIVAVYAFSMFIASYICGRASDIYDRRLFIRLGLALSTITFFLQTFTDPFFAAPLLADPWLLALVRGLAGFTLGIFPAALTVYVYDSAQPLGEFTSFGALGWAVGTFVAGLIAFYYGVFIMASLCLLIGFLVSLTMKKIDSTCLRVPFFPKDLLKRNWRVYVPYMLRHTGANVIWVIYPLYIASLGGDKFWIGVIYTINTATQFVVMRFLDRFNSERLIRTGLLLAIATFISFAFAQNFTHLFPMQIMIACSWSCMYVGSLLYLMKNNVERATSSGLLGSVINISQVFGALIGGTISLVFGDFRATMIVATFLTIIGLVLFQVGNRKRLVDSLKP